ncbi:MAG: hypothetical protein AAFQ05_03390 [Pseudomonadota bacterium]
MVDVEDLVKSLTQPRDNQMLSGSLGGKGKINGVCAVMQFSGKSCADHRRLISLKYYGLKQQFPKSQKLDRLETNRITPENDMMFLLYRSVTRSNDGVARATF